MEITLEFKTKKEYNRFIKQLGAGKGFVVREHHIKGGSIGSFFRMIGRNVKKLGKSAAKIALPMIGSAMGSEFGPAGMIAGNVAGQMGANAIGNGILSDLKRAGRKISHGVRKIANSKEMKHIANSVRPALRQLKGIAKEAVHQSIANATIDAASHLGESDPLKQAALNVISNTAHEKVAGMGLSAKDRMAWVRSHKKGGNLMKKLAKDAKAYPSVGLSWDQAKAIADAKRGSGVKGKKSLKLPQDLQIFNSTYKGGSFQPL